MEYHGPLQQGLYVLFPHRWLYEWREYLRDTSIAGIVPGTAETAESSSSSSSSSSAAAAAAPVSVVLFKTQRPPMYRAIWQRYACPSFVPPATSNNQITRLSRLNLRTFQFLHSISPVSLGVLLQPPQEAVREGKEKAEAAFKKAKEAAETARELHQKETALRDIALKTNDMNLLALVDGAASGAGAEGQVDGQKKATGGAKGKKKGAGKGAKKGSKKSTSSATSAASAAAAAAAAVAVAASSMEIVDEEANNALGDNNNEDPPTDAVGADDDDDDAVEMVEAPPQQPSSSNLQQHEAALTAIRDLRARFLQEKKAALKAADVARQHIAANALPFALPLSTWDIRKLFFSSPSSSASPVNSSTSEAAAAVERFNTAERGLDNFLRLSKCGHKPGEIGKEANDRSDAKPVKKAVAAAASSSGGSAGETITLDDSVDEGKKEEKDDAGVAGSSTAMDVDGKEDNAPAASTSTTTSPKVPAASVFSGSMYDWSGVGVDGSPSTVAESGDSFTAPSAPDVELLSCEEFLDLHKLYRFLLPKDTSNGSGGSSSSDASSLLFSDVSAAFSPPEGNNGSQQLALPTSEQDSKLAAPPLLRVCSRLDVLPDWFKSLKASLNQQQQSQQQAVSGSCAHALGYPPLVITGGLPLAGGRKASAVTTATSGPNKGTLDVTEDTLTDKQRLTDHTKFTWQVCNAPVCAYCFAEEMQRNIQTRRYYVSASDSIAKKAEKGVSFVLPSALIKASHLLEHDPVVAPYESVISAPPPQSAEGGETTSAGGEAAAASASSSSSASAASTAIVPAATGGRESHARAARGGAKRAPEFTLTDLSYHNTIAELKNHILQCRINAAKGHKYDPLDEAIPAVIYHNGKQIPDHFTLAEAGVLDGDTIYYKMPLPPTSATAAGAASGSSGDGASGEEALLLAGLNEVRPFVDAVTPTFTRADSMAVALALDGNNAGAAGNGEPNPSPTAALGGRLSIPMPPKEVEAGAKSNKIGFGKSRFGGGGFNFSSSSSSAAPAATTTAASGAATAATAAASDSAPIDLT
jgi:hypothetical protein